MSYLTNENGDVLTFNNTFLEVPDSEDWPDSEGYIYNYGDYEDYWRDTPITTGNATFTFNKNVDNMFAEVSNLVSSDAVILILTTESVDITNIDTIEIYNVANNALHTYLGLYTNYPSTPTEYLIFSEVFGSQTLNTASIDVSSITGSVYIGFYVYTDKNDEGIYIYSIKLI